MICITYNVRGGKALPCTPEELQRARSLSSVVDTSERLRDLTLTLSQGEGTLDIETRNRLEEEKKKLKLARPAILPHASSFDDYERKNSKAHPSGQVLFDIDHYDGDIKAFYEEKIAPHVEEWKVSEVEISASYDGLHILFVKPKGMTIQQAQKWMAENLGVKYDEGTFDLARACFCVPENYVLFQNDELLFGSIEIAEDELSLYQMSEKKVDSKVSSTEDIDTDKLADANQFALKAFDLCLAEAGLTQNEIDIPGERNWHNTLKAILSVGLCQIVEKKQLLAVLKVRMPNYFDTDDCKRLVADFYKNYTDENGRMSLTLRKIYSAALKDSASTLSMETEEEETDSTFGCPQLPKKLPPLIAHLLSNVPDMYKPAVANAVFPSLAAHLHGVEFNYVDNQRCEAGISTLLIAKAGIGKGAVNAPIENIIRDFVIHDEADRMRLQQWKDNYQKCSDKDHRPIRPTDIYIQVPESDMTSAALIQLLLDLERNGDRCLYQKMDEVEMLGRIRTSGGCDTDRLICLGYDRAKYGAERASANSISGNPLLRWNWNASTTPVGARKFLRNSLINGTLSRLNLATIFKEPVKRDKNGKRKRSLPVFGTYDEQYYETLKPYIDNLNAANGLIECEDVNKLMLEIIDNCEDTLEEMNNDDVYDSLWHRGCVIGFRKAMALYIASGYEWTKEMAEFIRWSVEYDLWVKMYYFHEMIRQELQTDELLTNANITDQRCSVLALLSQLNDTFTTEELIALRVKNGQSTVVRYVLSRWKKSGLIKAVGKQQWQKT